MKDKKEWINLLNKMITDYALELVMLAFVSSILTGITSCISFSLFKSMIMVCLIDAAMLVITFAIIYVRLAFLGVEDEEDD